MKRNKVANTISTNRGTRAVDARRLAAVRGGSGLGIAVAIVHPRPHIMQNQHNEILINISSPTTRSRREAQ